MSLRSDRGAVLVHVAVCLLALTAFSALAVDFGVLWVARAQAQNSADAGAHAGAVALAFDGFADRGDTGAAKQTANAIALANQVWLESPAINLSADITFPEGNCTNILTGDPASHLGQSPCIRVDVHRTQAAGNPLPTFFAKLVGVQSQSIRATATAQVISANASDCVAPLAVPDRWTEQFPAALIPWHTNNPALSFRKFASQGVLLPVRDIYVPPSATSVGTGLQVDDIHGGVGYAFGLREAPQPFQPIGPRQFVPVHIPRATAAADEVLTNIEECNGQSVTIGQTLEPIVGSSVFSSVNAGLLNVIGDDVGAMWNPGLNRIQNSCAANNPPCAAFSPRLIVLPVFDVAHYDETRWDGTPEIRIVNFVGYFVEAPTSNQVNGRFAYHPGLINSTAPSLLHASAYLRTAILVR